MIKTLLKDIADRMEEREVILTLLLTGIFLLICFVAGTRLASIDITYPGYGEVLETHTVHISYYGLPFEMLGIFQPIGGGEEFYVYMYTSRTGTGTIQMFWGGFLTDFVLCFLSAFIIVYLSRRLKG